MIHCNLVTKLSWSFSQSPKLLYSNKEREFYIQNTFGSFTYKVYDVHTIIQGCEAILSPIQNTGGVSNYVPMCLWGLIKIMGEKHLSLCL